jgi:ribonuclease P protein component
LALSTAIHVKRGFRLRNSIDIKRVRQKGSSNAHPFVVLFSLRNQGEGLRVAMTAGRAVGGAVQRNRAKRVLRAAVQPILPKLSVDYDVLLMARPAIREAKSTEVGVVLSALFKKAKLFN